MSFWHVPPQLSSRVFSLHFSVKRCTGNEVGCDRVALWTSQIDIARTSCKCLKQLSLTTKLNILYEGYYYSHISKCYNQSRELELSYIRWLWAKKSKSCLLALENLLFYIFRRGASGWCEPKNFVILALYFTKFNYNEISVKWTWHKADNSIRRTVALGTNGS